MIYCDKEFLVLIKILMKNDSLSYMYVSDTEKNKDKFMNEFESSSEETIESWVRHYILIGGSSSC